MHTRRLASFLLGAWLLGCLIVGFVASENFQSVDRILTNPPGPVAKDLEDLGSDITRMLLRFQASEMNRFLFKVWGVVQIGIGAAFVFSAVFTAHRSRFLVIVGAAMAAIVLLEVAYMEPAMTALGRSFDFLPASAALRDRENFQSFHVMYGVAEVVKFILGLLVAGRLLFDRYGWQQKFLPGPPKRRLERRRKIRPDGTPEPIPAGAAGSDAGAIALDAPVSAEDHRD